jgi:hypothetical protein
MTSSSLPVHNAPLFLHVLDSQNLLAAWEKVEENAGGPGVDGVSVDIFGATAEEAIPRLQDELRIFLVCRMVPVS